MDKKVATSTLVSVLLLLAVVGIGFNPLVTANPTPTLYIDPPSIGRLAGESFTVDIRIKDVEEASHLIGWQVRLSYDTTLLDVSATQEGPFLNETAQLQPGSMGTYYIEIVEEGLGNVTLGCLILPNATGHYNPPWPSGSGVLANVTFSCTGLGKCVLDLEPFAGELLYDETPNPIPATAEDGYAIQTIPSDINRDGIVDIVDATICSLALWSQPGDPDWNPDADLNGDNLINIIDLVIVGINFGNTV